MENKKSIKTASKLKKKQIINLCKEISKKKQSFQFSDMQDQSYFLSNQHNCFYYHNNHTSKINDIYASTESGVKFFHPFLFAFTDRKDDLGYDPKQFPEEYHIQTNSEQHQDRNQLYIYCAQIFQMLPLQISSHEPYNIDNCIIDAIRAMNRMQFVDNSISQTSQRIFRDFPSQMKVLRKLGKYFKYQNKNLYSSFALLFTKQLEEEQRNKALNFLTAVESITLGFQLHHNIGTNYRPNTLVQIGLKIIQKVIKDKYLVLAGDYFHIKASVLGSQTKNIFISKLLSEIEINLCKCVYLQEELKKKIDQTGYGSISVSDIHEINTLRARQIAQGLMGIDMIKSIPYSAESEQVYNCIGLMILYRKQLQNFMFNFYKLIGKYLQYTKSIRMNFCDQYTLTNYIFYQSAQQNQRIDLAYLNTVQMMSSEIQYLEMRLKKLMKQGEYDIVMRKINYIMMVHS